MDKVLTLSYACTGWPSHKVKRATGPPDSQGLVVGSPRQEEKNNFLTADIEEPAMYNYCIY